MTGEGEHWLWRLDADGWLRAAHAELEAGADNVAQRRTAVTHARRAAGMAINAVLVAWGRALGTDEALAAAEERWGRSYIEHLRALGEATPELLAPLGPRSAEAARALMTIAVVPPAGLVQLHASPHAAAQQALDHAHALVHECTLAVAALRAGA